MISKTANIETEKKDLIICNVLCVWLLMDSINGYFVRESVSIPISIFYKLIVVFLISLRILNYKSGLRLILSLLVYLLFQALFYATINVADMIVTYQFLLKPITNIIIYFYFVKLVLKDNLFAKKSIYKIFKYNFIIYACNLILGLCGFGYRAYESAYGDIGFTGFFYSLNELGGVAASIFPFILYNQYEKGRKNFYLASIFVIFLSFLIMSKATILTAFISILLILYIKCKNRKLFIFFCVVVILYAIFHFNIDDLLSSQSAYAQKAMYTYGSGGILNLIFSGRINFVLLRTREFFDSPFIIQMFGLGGNRTVELDPVDVMLNIGYFGLLIYFLIWSYLMRQLLVNRYRNRYIPIIMISNIILFGMGCMAGHIFFSSTAGLFVASLNALVYEKEE